MKSVQFEKMVLELKAIDLNLTDESFQRFEISNMIQCVSTERFRPGISADKEESVYYQLQEQHRYVGR